MTPVGPPLRSPSAGVEWKALPKRPGFAVRSVPQSQGTAFAKVLLVADLP